MANLVKSVLDRWTGAQERIADLERQVSEGKAELERAASASLEWDSVLRIAEGERDRAVAERDSYRAMLAEIAEGMNVPVESFEPVPPVEV